MKSTIIVIACLIAAALCQTYPYTVSNDCSSVVCDRNYWNIGTTSYSYACPLAGYNNAAFIVQNNQVSFNFTAYNMVGSNQRVSIPLIYNPAYQSTGLQYFQTLSNGAQFSVLNCTIPNASSVSNLCQYHELVAGKYINNIFVDACAFGLN